MCATCLTGRAEVLTTVLAHVNITAYRSTYIAEAGALVEDGLIKTWVTVGIRVLLVIVRVLVYSQTVDGLIRVNEVLGRIGTAC